MKCAYCKEDAGKDPNEYVVEINGVECRICLHYDCLKKVIGKYFSRKPEVTPMSNDHITINPKDYHPWTLTPQSIPCGGTADCPPPNTTRVWCKTDYESTHSPWKDRVD